MKKNMINAVHLEGLLYQHNLTKKIAGANAKTPGLEFIQGTLDIATDDACTNIVQVHYSYVTPKFGSSGKDNPNFATLLNIINGTMGTVMANGKENAAMLRIDSAVGVNDFYTDRNGTTELVSSKRNEGGFIHTTNSLASDENLRSTFDLDMFINGTALKEADEERGLPEKLVLKGIVFDFRNAVVPVELSVVNSDAIKYFENLDISSKSPVFTRVKGHQISETVVKTIEEEGAFGTSVREVTNTRKDWVVTWAAAEPYELGDETTLTSAELKKAMADRETYLADVKKRNDDYKASKAGGQNFNAVPKLQTPTSDFDF